MILSRNQHRTHFLTNIAASFAVVSALWSSVAVGQVVPGTEPPRILKAAETFAWYCVEQFPDFLDTPEKLRNAGLILDSASGVFHHPELNLSARIGPVDGKSACTVGFASDLDHRVVRRAFNDTFDAYGIYYDLEFGDEGLLAVGDIEDGGLYNLVAISREGTPYYAAIIAVDPK